MAVYVNPMCSCLPNKRWPYTEACHLTGDTFAELRAFAREIGLKDVWIQRGILLHYDLTRRKRALAITHGAISLTHPEAVNRLRVATGLPPLKEPG